ncbi:hypothetical protein niasHT_028729 [Heterodera trifolii]|uniref:Uncharacterized protein n=1 Tax=Heterodera trifolii TaxID=157864 RepID=A0ABD2JCN9_9BILA
MFGFGSNGTLSFSLTNFTVPDAVLKQTQKDGGEDKLGHHRFHPQPGSGIYQWRANQPAPVPTAAAGKALICYSSLSISPPNDCSLSVSTNNRRAFSSCSSIIASIIVNMDGYNLAAIIVEKNVNSFLSVVDIPKPSLYVYFAFLFALVTIFSNNISKVIVLCWCSSFSNRSLLFHGINFYFVSVYGHERELWAIIYYVTHFLKGALRFSSAQLF